VCPRMSHISLGLHSLSRTGSKYCCKVSLQGFYYETSYLVGLGNCTTVSRALGTTCRHASIPITTHCTSSQIRRDFPCLLDHTNEYKANLYRSDALPAGSGLLGLGHCHNVSAIAAQTCGLSISAANSGDKCGQLMACKPSRW
jgi:hypothetical protein